jgi:iron complex outermembrane recepter protein
MTGQLKIYFRGIKMKTYLKSKCKLLEVNKFLLFAPIVLMSSIGQGAEIECSNKVLKFDLEAKELDLALSELALHSGIKVVFYSDVVQKIESKPIVGEYNCKVAIDNLLEGTNLHYSIINDNTIAIHEGRDFSGSLSSNDLQLAANGNVSLDLKEKAAVPDKKDLGGRADTYVYEEVIVTATKRSRSIQDTAMAISALTKSTIERRNLVGMGDYLSSLPGVSVLDQGPGFNSVIVRGLSANPQTEGADSSPITGVYFGETAISGFGVLGNTTDIKLVDIERVEVLKGPQGTLYGAGAMGGVVRNIPVLPDTSEFQGEFQVGYSSTAEEGGDNFVTKGVINTPIIEDTLALRLVAYQFENSGYYKNVAATDPVVSSAVTTFGATAVNEDDRGSDEVVGGRVSVLWQPTDHFSVNLSYLNQSIDTNGWGQADLDLAGGFSQRRLSTRSSTSAPGYGQPSQDEGYQDEIEIANLTIEYDLSWADLVSSTSWVDEAGEYNRDLSAFLAPGYLPWGQHVDYSASLFSEEIRLASTLKGRWQYLLGFYYEKRETGFENFGLFSSSDATLNIFSPGEFLLIRNSIDRDMTQHAFFGELSYDLTDKVKVTVGGRAFDYDRDLVNQTFDSAFAADTLTSVDSGESDHSLKVGIEFTPNDSTLLYAIWSEGFRLGYPQPAEQLPASVCAPDGDGFYDGSNGISTGTRLIESDFVENFELGGKFSMLNNQLTVNTSVYQINWEGIPVVQQFDFCNATANAGEARSRGAEVEVTYYWNEHLQFNVSSSYTDAELTSDAEAIGAQAGDRLPGAARYNASLGVEYSFMLGDYESYLRSDYVRVGGFYNNLQEMGTEAGNYGRLTVKAGVAVNQFDIDIYVNNLTNEDSITWVDSEGFIGERGNRLRPRSVGFNVAYQF